MSEQLHNDPGSPTSDIWAIDVHGHYGTYFRSAYDRLTNEFHSATAEEVARRAQVAGIEWTVVSPLSGLFPRGEADASLGNSEAEQAVPACPGLLQWVIIDPTNAATYSQAEEMLQQPHCVGIKIHPEEHVYPFREHGRRIFEFAAQWHAIVLTHSGHANSLPTDIVEVANDFPELQVILAHIGCSDSSDRTLQVRAIQEATHGNVFADTSSAMSLTPGLIEWAVSEVGADRILFGTDTPLYATSMQRARIDLADISDTAKRKILRENAQKLLQLPTPTETVTRIRKD